MVHITKDVDSLLIECPVTCCDVLNQDKFRSLVGSSQLLWLISNLLISHKSCDCAIAERYLFHIYYWTDSSTCSRSTSSTLNIVIEAFGNSSSKLCINSCNLLLPPPTRSWFQRNGIFLCYGLRLAVQSRGKGNQQTSCVNMVHVVDG